MEPEPMSTMPPQRAPYSDGTSVDINMFASGTQQQGLNKTPTVPEQVAAGTGFSNVASGPNPATSQMIPDSIASAMTPTSTPATAFIFEALPSGAPGYNEAWEDSLMEYMLNARKRDLTKKRLAESQHLMQQGMGASANLNFQTVPVTPAAEVTQNPLSPSGDRAVAVQPSSPSLEVKLPLPLDNPLRTFSFQVPHAHAANLPFLTHPHGSVYGGRSPFPSPDASAFAADIIDAYEFKHKSAMTRYIHRELNKHIDELERKMKARKAAKESNDRVKKELKELEKERALEVKAMERWRVEMARKARIKGGGVHKGIGGR